jgi:hypothetical protein
VVKTFFETAISGTMKERTVWKSTHVRMYTSPSTVLFETLDMDADAAWVHKSFINKGKDKEKGKDDVVVPLDQDSRLNLLRER